MNIEKSIHYLNDRYDKLGRIAGLKEGRGNGTRYDEVVTHGKFIRRGAGLDSKDY